MKNYANVVTQFLGGLMDTAGAIHMLNYLSVTAQATPPHHRQ